MKAPISVENVVASFLHYICDKGRYRKTVHSFEISGASVSLIIRLASCSIVKYLSSDYRKVPKSPEEVEHSTSLFLETHGFSKCLGAIDETHIVVIEPQPHYTD